MTSSKRVAGRGAGAMEIEAASVARAAGRLDGELIRAVGLILGQRARWW